MAQPPREPGSPRDSIHSRSNTSARPWRRWSRHWSTRWLIPTWWVVTFGGIGYLAGWQLDRGSGSFLGRLVVGLAGAATGLFAGARRPRNRRDSSLPSPR